MKRVRWLMKNSPTFRERVQRYFTSKLLFKQFKEMDVAEKYLIAAKENIEMQRKEILEITRSVKC